MGDVVNLNRARKAKTRAEDKARAEANRVRFGRTKAEKEALSLDKAREGRLLDGHRLTQTDEPSEQS